MQTQPTFVIMTIMVTMVIFSQEFLIYFKKLNGDLATNTSVAVNVNTVLGELGQMWKVTHEEYCPTFVCSS